MPSGPYGTRYALDDMYLTGLIMEPKWLPTCCTCATISYVLVALCVQWNLDNPTSIGTENNDWNIHVDYRGLFECSFPIRDTKVGVGLYRMLDYRGVRLLRFHCTT